MRGQGVLALTSAAERHASSGRAVSPHPLAPAAGSFTRTRLAACCPRTITRSGASKAACRSASRPHSTRVSGACRMGPGAAAAAPNTSQQPGQAPLLPPRLRTAPPGFTTLHILPHVDPVDYSNRGMWRNVVKFNPTQKLGPGGAAFSYEDVSANTRRGARPHLQHGPLVRAPAHAAASQKPGLPSSNSPTSPPRPPPKGPAAPRGRGAQRGGGRGHGRGADADRRAGALRVHISQ